MRALIYVPIVHSEVDLGSMADELRRRFQGAFGVDEWKQRFASVDAMWGGIHGKLSALPLPWRRTRLYQDGLPVFGREHDIVRELAAKGSLNHQLLAELSERGATIMGTEDPELMLREYRRIQKLVRAARSSEAGPLAEELKREGDAILRDRDVFIARRIDATLEDGETGILFLGLLHRVDDLLEGKFEVRHLIHNLPFAADPWRKLKERGHVD